MQRHSNWFNPISHSELNRKTAIHEAGHAAAIYLGNKQKRLPVVFFRIFIREPNDDLQISTCLCQSYDSHNNCITKLEGGRLIHTLPASIEKVISHFSLAQKQAYLQAFDADIFNLMVGPVAEANYIAQRDGELINSHLINLEALHYYGGASDLETIYDYIGRLIPDAAEREEKLSQLYSAAFNFIIDRSNWRAIMALADYILAGRKNTLECEEIIAVLDAHFFAAGRNVRHS